MPGIEGSPRQSDVARKADQHRRRQRLFDKKKAEYANSGNYLTRGIAGLSVVGKNSSITRINEKLRAFQSWSAHDVEARQEMLIALGKGRVANHANCSDLSVGNSGSRSGVAGGSPATLIRNRHRTDNFTITPQRITVRSADRARPSSANSLQRHFSPQPTTPIRLPTRQPASV